MWTFNWYNQFNWQYAVILQSPFCNKKALVLFSVMGFSINVCCCIFSFYLLIIFEAISRPNSIFSWDKSKPQLVLCNLIGNKRNIFQSPKAFWRFKLTGWHWVPTDLIHHTVWNLRIQFLCQLPYSVIPCFFFLTFYNGS